ncbi:MAG: hypothetical protein KKD28_06540 [Chloroflexi bacterium]|nr:hypothetical protein [Chloroflexota bacterium]MBU1661114.1 hypothetical protein [Chloroflexota bacterium]
MSHGMRYLFYLALTLLVLTGCQTSPSTQAATPIPPTSNDAISQPVAIPISDLIAAELVVRTGPDEDYPATKLQLGMGQGAAVIGRNTDGNWLLIEFGLQLGWIQASQVTVSSSLSDVPIALDTVWQPNGVTFTGPLEMSIPGRNATAGQGSLELTIRPDGAAIVFLRYSLRRANCYNDSGTIRHEDYGWTTSFPLPEPAFIVDGMFEFNYAGELKVSGQFTSPTEAIATVEISTEEPATGGSFTCDFGTWIWSGEVK